ncbi:MAG: hypothetical protein AAB479_00980 [Patescibacteria group bacterium]
MSNVSKGRLQVLKKTFAVLTALTTMLSLAGFAAYAPKASAAFPADFGLQEGNTISAAGSSDPDIYIVNAPGYKRLFLNPVIFNFYGHLGGFPAVKNVAATTRDAFPTSGLFRNCETNDPKVYGVETTGEDTGILHWVNTSGAQAVADDANFFNKVFCINNNEFNWYAKGADYTSVSQVPNYVRGTPPPTGPLSVSLASSNPASGTIVDGQARYNLAEFMFGGNGAVTNVKLNRIGVSADATLTNVYLYDGVKRLTDAATVSSGVVSFNDAVGLFTVSGSKVISVLADVDGTAGETIGVQLTSVNGVAYSISGNMHTLATATQATTALSASVTPSSDGAPVPASDFVAWNDAVTIGTRYVWLKSVQYRVIGSVAAGDLQNFRLLIDGVQQGSTVAQADANGYIVFDMTASPVKLETGSRTFKVLVDIIGGSGKNFYLSLRQKSDIWTVDSQYAGASVLATGTFPVSSTAQNIASGTLTITKTTDSPSGNVVKGASGVVLSRFEFKAAGEKMKVENLRIDNSSGQTALLALRNAAIFADGVQVGSTTTLWEDSSPAASNSTAYAQVSLGSSLIVTPGTPRIVEIRADIFDASGTNDVAADQTFTANFAVGSSNVQRLTTLDYVSSAAKTGTSLTIKIGSLTAGKYTGYANQSVVDPKNNVKVGHFTLTAASSESVNVSSIDIMPQLVTGVTFDGGELDDSYIKVWNDAGSLVYTSPVKAIMSESASTSFAVNFSLPANKTYQIEVWANVEAGITALDAVRLAFSATGTTAGSSTSTTSSVVAGQTITSQTGALTKANGSLPSARFVNGGSTVTGYQFTLTPTYDDYYLDEVYVDLSSTLASSSGAVANLQLKNSVGTVIGSAVVSSSTSSASFTGLDLLMPQSEGTKTFTVDVVTSAVGVGANDTAGNVTVQLDGLKFRDSAGAITTENGYAPASFTGNANYVVKGYPTFANKALSTTALSAGTQTLFKTEVSATGSQVGWNNITFTVSSTSLAGTFGPAAAGWKLYENGIDITSFSGSSTASVSDIGTTTRVEFTFAVERVISAGTPIILELKTTVGGTLATNESVTTSITNPKGTTVTTDDSTVQRNSGASFVWTDSSAASHATTTDDWFTDGMLKTLAESQTLTK